MGVVSTVIKAGQAGTIIPRLSTVDLADHLEEARAVVEAAERKARQMITDAKEESRRMFVDARRSGQERGYAVGYEGGQRAGYDAAHQESTQKFDRQHGAIVEDMKRAIGKINEIEVDLRIDSERDLLEFAVQFAGKMTYAIGGLDGKAVKENFQRAVRYVRSKRDLTVRLHPQDESAFHEFAPEVMAHFDDSVNFRLKTDGSIAPGGCVVEADGTIVDATLETQMDEMVALLLGKGSNDG